MPDEDADVPGHGASRGTERRRSRTYPAPGCDASPVLKTGWATGPVPLRAQPSAPPAQLDRVQLEQEHARREVREEVERVQDEGVRERARIGDPVRVQRDEDGCLEDA